MATKLDLADAQFIGFRHAKSDGTDIIGLVIGMGLSRAEWEKWKAKYSTSPLNEREIQEIDNYFK